MPVFDPFEIEYLACPLMMYDHLGALIVGDQAWKTMVCKPGGRVLGCCKDLWNLIEKFDLPVVDSRGQIGCLSSFQKLTLKPGGLKEEEIRQLELEMNSTINPILEYYRNGHVWNQGQFIIF